MDIIFDELSMPCRVKGQLEFPEVEERETRELELFSKVKNNEKRLI